METVESYFGFEKIDIDFISENFEGEYWDACDNFIRSNWSRDMDTMSEKQINWLTRILKNCIEKRIEKKN